MEHAPNCPHEKIEALAKQIAAIGGDRVATIAKGFIRQDLLFGQAATAITTMGFTLGTLGKPEIDREARNTANKLSGDFMELTSSLALNTVVELLKDDDKAGDVYELMRQMQELSRASLRDDVTKQVKEAMAIMEAALLADQAAGSKAHD